jgi:thiol-disulfide isomerase/thioredoxin
MFSTKVLLKRCAMAAIVVASTALAAGGDASGPAPAFTLTTLAGQTSGLSAYKGQVVMVNFWATWCGPCQQEMPLLDQMYKKYKPAGFTLIGVNVDKMKCRARSSSIAKARFATFTAATSPATKTTTKIGFVSSSGSRPWAAVRCCSRERCWARCCCQAAAASNPG